MKKARKGFTLIELVIVIGIMGMLGAMGMMAGQQATDAAKASNIAANLEMAGAAMMAYYEDNAATIDVSGADVLKGTQAFVKETLTNGSTELTAGSYSVVLSAESDKDAKWFVAYKLLDAEAASGRKIGAVLENKKTRMNLYKAATSTTADYEGGTDVYMLVR